MRPPRFRTVQRSLGSVVLLLVLSGSDASAFQAGFGGASYFGIWDTIDRSGTYPVMGGDVALVLNLGLFRHPVNLRSHWAYRRGETPDLLPTRDTARRIRGRSGAHTLAVRFWGDDQMKWWAGPTFEAGSFTIRSGGHTPDETEFRSEASTRAYGLTVGFDRAQTGRWISIAGGDLTLRRMRIRYDDPFPGREESDELALRGYLLFGAK